MNKQRNKSANSLFIFSQIIVHHDHNLLVGDAIPVDNLVGMASIGLSEQESKRFGGQFLIITVCSLLSSGRSTWKTCIREGKLAYQSLKRCLSKTMRENYRVMHSSHGGRSFTWCLQLYQPLEPATISTQCFPPLFSSSWVGNPITSPAVRPSRANRTDRHISSLSVGFLDG